MARRHVGLDIGQRAVRAVALVKTKAGWRVDGHAMVLRQDAAGVERPLPVVLSELDSLVSLTRAARLTVADSGHTNLVRFVSTIPMPPERLAKLLRLEISQHADAGGELAADAMAVPLAGDELIHCCVLAQPAQVYSLLADLKAAGIVPTRVHFAPAAAYNATLPSRPAVDDALALLVDIGAGSTRVVLFGERRLLACRQIAIGGAAFTEALSRTREIPAERAEDIKQQWAVAQAGDGAAAAGPASAADEAREDWLAEEPLAIAPAEAGAPLVVEGTPPASSDSDRLEYIITGVESEHDGAAHVPAAPGMAALSDRLPLIEPPPPGMATRVSAQATLGPELTRVAEALYTQLASSQSWFRAQLHQSSLDISTVHLSGGGAVLAGLDSYLQRRFGVPVKRFDPFDGLEGEPPERPYEYVTALGLALTDAKDAVRLDLLPEKLILRRQWRQQLVWPFVAAAALLVAAGLLAWTLWNENEVNRASLAAYADHQRRYAGLKATLDGLDQQKVDLAEDLRAIVSRIHSGRDLLYSIRALKEQSAKAPELWVTKLETVGVSQDAMPAPAGGASRLGGGAPPAVRNPLKDTAIQRGALDISGLVKFDSDKSLPELNDFFNQYRQAIEVWRPGPTRPPLFDERRTKVVQHIIESRDQNRDGRFPFQVRFFFQPTELQQVTVETSDRGGRR